MDGWMDRYAYVTPTQPHHHRCSNNHKNDHRQVEVGGAKGKWVTAAVKQVHEDFQVRFGFEEGCLLVVYVGVFVNICIYIPITGDINM